MNFVKGKVELFANNSTIGTTEDIIVNINSLLIVRLAGDKYNCTPNDEIRKLYPDKRIQTIKIDKKLLDGFIQG